jgi:predicted ATP-dependent endonuclease of OLD family
MLESILIQGFQRHKFLEIELDPHITVFVGPNDAGKSSAIRALRWLATNKPKGSSFINWSKKKAHVVLKVDGQKITRSKGTRNLYKLDQRKFKAFRSTPPESITKLLNISDATFQNQHDQIFQLSQSPGQISKELNKIINLEVIDRSLSKIAARARLVKSYVEVNKQRLQKARESKKSLVWIVGFSKSLGELIQRQQSLESSRAGTLLTQELLEKAITARQTLKASGERLQSGKKSLQQIKPKIEEYEKSRYLTKELEDLLEEAEQKEIKRKICQKQLDLHLQKLKDWKIGNPLCPLCSGPIP